MTFMSESGRNIPVRLEVNPRAKRLILRLDKRTGEAIAVAPSKRLLRQAAAFAQARLSWIEQQLDSLRPGQPFSEGAMILLRGRACRITAEGTGHLPDLRDGDPQTLSLPGEATTLPARALRYLKRAAREDLTRSVERYATQLSVTPKRISVKDTRSRWGSCRADGNLSFSWRLILADPFVLEYVAAHEVAHLIEMNHSPAFWAHVESIYPDWRRARNWLRAHGSDLHAIGAEI